MPVEEELRLILGDYIYGYDSDTPSSVVADLLLARGLTLGIIETSTGGHVASTIMDDPRAAVFFKGASVAPSIAALATLGVPQPLLADKGIASMEAAMAMASSARSHFGASIGLGITGVLRREESGATPFGSINVALDDGELRTSDASFPTIPAEIKRWAMLNALNLVRLRLLGAA